MATYFYFEQEVMILLDKDKTEILYLCLLIKMIFKLKSLKINEN